MKNFKDIINNERAINIVLFIVGIVIGALFYPSKKKEEKLIHKYEQQISVLKEKYEQEMKHITDTFTKTLEETKYKLLESEKKVASLTVEIKNLKIKQKTMKYKIVRPDGTIEEKEFTETQTKESNKLISQIKEQFNIRITEIEKKWSDIHKERAVKIQKEFERKEFEYKSKIASLEREKKTSINEKQFGLEFGVLTDQNYYGHGMIDISGPMFLGLHGEIGKNNNNKLGIGLGIRF